MSIFRNTALLSLSATIGGCMTNVSDRSRVTFLQEDTGPIVCVTYSPDGKRLALGTGGFDARVWDATSGRQLFTLGQHTSAISSVAFSPAGTTLAVGSYDKTVSFWSVAEAKSNAVIRCNSQVSRIAYAPDGESFAVAAVRYIKMWELTDHSLKERLTVAAQARGISFSADSKSLLALLNDRSIKVWDVNTGAVQSDISTRLSGDPLLMELSPDGTMLCIADHLTVSLLKYDGGRTENKVDFKLSVTCLAFSPRGNIMAAGVIDKTVRFWDTSNGRDLATLTGHAGRVNSIAFSPDGRTLASASDDRTIKLWNVPND